MSDQPKWNPLVFFSTTYPVLYLSAGFLRGCRRLALVHSVEYLSYEYALVYIHSFRYNLVTYYRAAFTVLPRATATSRYHLFPKPLVSKTVSFQNR